MTDEEAKKLAIVTVAEAWAADALTLYAVDVTKSYPWCKRFTVMMVVSHEKKRTLVATDRQSTTLCFAERKDVPREVDRRARLAVLNDLLFAEGLALPGDLGAAPLASAVRAFLVAPGGYVGSRAFLEQETKSKAIDKWTYVAPHLPWAKERTPEERRALFVEHCEDPILLESNGSFTLSFSFFTHAGSVERWSITGDASRISSARESEALPSRTFSPPFA